MFSFDIVISDNIVVYFLAGALMSQYEMGMHHVFMLQSSAVLQREN